METQPPEPPAEILENLRDLFQFVTGGLLSFFPIIILIMGIIFLSVIAILFFLLSGTMIIGQ